MLKALDENALDDWGDDDAAESGFGASSSVGWADVGGGGVSRLAGSMAASPRPRGDVADAAGLSGGPSDGSWLSPPLGHGKRQVGMALGVN